jgi:hypothetical protein
MKKAAILALLALELAVSGCGGSSSTTSTATSTTNNWEAQLSGGVGSASELNFVTTFTVADTTSGSSQPLSITGFGFINTGACFVSGLTETGTASLTTGSTSNVTGSMSYTVTSGTPSGNTLTLTTSPNGGVSATSSGNSTTNGTLSSGIVWGEWQLTGGQGNAGCTGKGTFIMCQNAATCTIP